MTRHILAERTTGYRRLTGTDFPIVDRLERVEMPGHAPEWVITRSLCAGVPDSARTYTERRAAFDAWEGKP